MNKLVSVIMPVYNSSRFLALAIESVLAQTHQNFELIIIDDKSTDNSVAIARKYAEADLRIKIIECSVNQGVAKARNLGISVAKGDYVALLDSDDIWLAEKIERQLLLLEKQGAAIAYCSYDFVDENGKSVMKPFIVDTETNFKKMLNCNAIGCSTVLIESNLIKANPFDDAYYHEDYALWMKLLSIPVKAAGIPEVLTHYRRVSGSRSDNKIRSARERWNIYRKMLNMGFIKSAVAFAGYFVSSMSKYF